MNKISIRILALLLLLVQQLSAQIFNPVKWSYTLNGTEKRYDKASCYSSMTDKADFITLYDLDCEKTIKYKMFYLQYVSDMYNLNAEITEEYFKFKCQGGRYKNMLVCATIRLLWEELGYKKPAIPLHDVFFEKLQNGKSKLYVLLSVRFRI